MYPSVFCYSGSTGTRSYEFSKWWVKAGWNMVVGTKKENVVNAVLGDSEEDFTKRKWTNFYGNGNAAEKITKVLLSYEE
jgi:UDP-N-acetylglucosamine 2-epimerase